VVAESAASYRRGLESAFRDQGWEVVGEGSEPDVAVVACRAGDECEQVARWSAIAAIVVALVDPLDAKTLAHATGHGAAVATAWTASPERIVEVAEAVLRGDFLVPVEVGRELAAVGPDPHETRPQVTAVEAGWLRTLAAGATVAELAEDAGYSERSMFRHLAAIYGTLGAANRFEALLAAERLGLLKPDSD
jgi:DNA-binding NarL/FixJ family response regulator